MASALTAFVSEYCTVIPDVRLPSGHVEFRIGPTEGLVFSVGIDEVCVCHAFGSGPCVLGFARFRLRPRGGRETFAISACRRCCFVCEVLGYTATQSSILNQNGFQCVGVEAGIQGRVCAPSTHDATWPRSQSTFFSKYRPSVEIPVMCMGSIHSSKA